MNWQRARKIGSGVFWTMAVVGWVLILWEAWPPG